MPHNRTIGAAQQVEAIGGLFSISNANASNLHWLKLADGAQVEGNMVRIGWNRDSCWLVSGTSPSFCNVDVNVIPAELSGETTYPSLSADYGGNMRVCTFAVCDVTGSGETDFTMGKSLGYSGNAVNTSANSDLMVRKTGAGTMRLNGVVNLKGGHLQLEGGTWLLGASDITKTNDTCTLAGGTLAAAANTANDVGELTVGEAGGTIDVGNDATLSFSDSSGATWHGRVIVKGFRDKAIRFGTSSSGLTDDQQKMLRTESGARLHLLSNGYLSTFGSLFIIQ